MRFMFGMFLPVIVILSALALLAGADLSFHVLVVSGNILMAFAAGNTYQNCSLALSEKNWDDVYKCLIPMATVILIFGTNLPSIAVQYGLPWWIGLGAFLAFSFPIKFTSVKRSR